MARRYRVLGLLGRGGFGRVYHAEQVGDDGYTQEVAIKLISGRPDAQAEEERRLRDEARMLGRVRHRAIVKSHDLVRLDVGQATILEYVDGADLGRILPGGGVPPRVALEIVAEIADALHTAWHWRDSSGQELHLLHRDLKPSNVCLTRDGDVKVLDFGAARAEFATRESETRGVLLGSMRYVAPERLLGVDSPAGDVWSLGVMLCELLLGRLDGVDFANRVAVGPELVGRVERVIADAGVGRQGAEVCALIRRMLAFAYAERPSVDQVGAEAARLVDALPGERLRSWARVAVAEARARAVPLAQDVPVGTVFREVSVAAEAEGTSFVRIPPGRAGVRPPLTGARARPAALWVAGILAGLGGLAVASGLGLAVWWWARQAGSSADTVDVPVAPVAAEAVDPEPVDPEPVDPEPPVASPSPAPQSRARAPAPAVEAAVPAPALAEPPPTEPPAAAPTEILVPGLASVELRQGGTIHAPGPVEPGSWEVWVDFPEHVEGLERAGVVKVAEGERLVLRCVAAVRRCSPGG